LIVRIIEGEDASGLPPWLRKEKARRTASAETTGAERQAIVAAQNK
jgi:hypothetical protein